MAVMITLDLDETVLAAARSLARAEGISLGAAVSALARRGLTPPASPVDVTYSPFPVLLSGVPGHVVTDEMVAAHRDE
jgi:hypothetical protein